jgi:hypothetical protein
LINILTKNFCRYIPITLRTVKNEVSSSHSHISPTSGEQAREPLQPDPREEATACWDVGKAVLQVHDESHLMTQTLQGFIEKEQEEWMRRKKQLGCCIFLDEGMVINPCYG